MMSIDEYCKTHGLPREDITSYKLISHTGVPFYNVVFKENNEILNEIDFYSIINKVIASIKIEKTCYNYKEVDDDLFTRLIYTDVHIGMETNEEGTAMYAEPWEKENILESLHEVCEAVIRHKVGDTLYIDELGDFLDGYNAETTRGGHALPQCMTNE